MKINRTSKIVNFLDTSYRFSYYFGSKVIEIETWEPKGKGWFGEAKWKRIYFGHDTVLREVLNFSEEQKQLDK